MGRRTRSRSDVVSRQRQVQQIFYAAAASAVIDGPVVVQPLLVLDEARELDARSWVPPT